jgi:type IV secretion system protein TrbL
MACAKFDLLCKGKDLAGDVVGGVAGSAIDALADAVSEAVGRAVASVGTLWVKVGTPNLTTTNGGSTPSATVGFLQGSLWWYMAAAAVLSVIIAGAKMAWEGRAEPGRELLKSLMTLVVVAGAGLTVISLAVAAADSFARWIIDSSLDGGDFGRNIIRLLGVTAVGGLGSIIVIILGLAAFVASLIQIALMVVRGGMLVILTGILPLSASATNTEWGRTWFKKCIGWLVAFILYKPAAAIVYATAFKLSSSDIFGSGDELMSAISGLVLMVLALVALPALMRFVTPMVGAMASGGSGVGSAMAAGAMVAMPTGAMRIPRGGSSNGAGAVAGSPGGPGPSGAVGPGGGRGPGGPSGAGPAGGAPAPAASGAAPAAGASAGAAAGGGGAVAGGAAAGSAAGPAGAVAGAVVGAAAQAAQGAKKAAQGAAESQTGDEGPSGSR